MFRSLTSPIAIHGHNFVNPYIHGSIHSACVFEDLLSRHPEGNHFTICLRSWLCCRLFGRFSCIFSILWICLVHLHTKKGSLDVSLAFH